MDKLNGEMVQREIDFNSGDNSGSEKGKETEKPRKKGKRESDGPEPPQRLQFGILSKLNLNYSFKWYQIK